MIKHIFNHWGKVNRFAYATPSGAEAYPAAQQASTEATDFWEGEVKIDLTTDLSDPNKRQTVMEKIAAKYGPEAFKNRTTKFISDQYPGIGNSPTIRSILTNVQGNYVLAYRNAFDSLDVKLESFAKDHKKALDEIRDATIESLKTLKKGLSAHAKAGAMQPEHEAVPENVDLPYSVPVLSKLPILRQLANIETVPIVGRPLAKIPIIGAILNSTDLPIIAPLKRYLFATEFREAELEFENYVSALSGKYMPDKDVRQSKLGRKFTAGMQRYAKESIVGLVSAKSADSAALKALDEKIVARYENLARADGIISEMELAQLEKTARLGSNLDDVEELTHLESQEDSIDFLEKVMIMNPDRWNELYAHMRDMVLKSAENYDSDAFIAFAQKNAQERGYDITIDSYNQAKTYFVNQLNRLARYDVKASLEFVQTFSAEIGKPMNDYLTEKVPENLQIMVMRERANLLSGRAILPSESPDELVVSFMKSDLSDRKAILANPALREELWVATQSILNSYQDQYDKTYAKTYEKGERVKTSAAPNKPLKADHAARLLTIIMLAHETEAFMNRALPKNSDARKYLESIQIDETPMKPNTNWAYGGDKAVSGVPTAAMYGFNMRTVGKRLFQAALITTIIFNAANAFKDIEKEGLEGVMQKLMTNPTTGAALAGLYVTQRPEILSGLTGKESSGNAERIGFIRTLNKVEEKLNKKEPQAASRIRPLLMGESEWDAIRTIRETKSPKDIQQMLREVKKTEGKYPTLSRKALEKVAGTGLQIADDQASNRARYVIYQALFTKKINLVKLKGDARAWAKAV